MKFINFKSSLFSGDPSVETPDKFSIDFGERLGLLLSTQVNQKCIWIVVHDFG